MRFVPPMKSHIVGKDQREGKRIDVLVDVLKNPVQRLALLFSGLIMMGHFMIVPFINPYMEFNNHYTKFQTPMIYLAGGIASFFAANILGRISDRHGKLRVFIICVLISLPVVITVTELPRIPFAFVLLIFAFWFILSTGRGVTAQAMISNVVDPAKRGGFMSFNSSVQQLGTAAASLIAGAVVLKGNHGEIYRYAWLGYLSVAILLLCVLIGNKIFRKPDSVTSNEHLHPAEAIVSQ